MSDQIALLKEHEHRLNMPAAVRPPHLSKHQSYGNARKDNKLEGEWLRDDVVIMAASIHSVHDCNES
jgi:hypothetical protein